MGMGGDPSSNSEFELSRESRGGIPVSVEPQLAVALQRMSMSMTGFYPWVGYQVNDKVSVWGLTGYGTGALSLTPDGAGALETGVSMAMSAVGTRGELIGSQATGGIALAFKADAMWVGAASDLLDGAAGTPERLRGGGDAGADRAGGLAGLQAGRPAVANAERRGGAAAGRRRRRDRRGHGCRRRAPLQRQGHGVFPRRAGAGDQRQFLPAHCLA